MSEVFHVEFVDHRYPPHSHGAWTVLIIDDGAVAYDVGGRARAAEPTLVTVLPPFVAHDGRSARAGRGFTKRVLYLDAETIGEALIGRAVDRSTIRSASLRADVSALHDTFGHRADDLQQEMLLDEIVDTIRRRLEASPRTDRAPSSEAAEALRADLEARPFDRHRLADAAARLGWNRSHLVRSFSATFGIPPHQYLISRRVEEARRQLLAGTAPAAVATNVGFHDQAHLTRHFRRHVGTTPARFVRAPRRSGGA